VGGDGFEPPTLSV